MKNISSPALAEGLSWLEHCPVHQKVAGSVPSQGTNLGCRFDPQSQCVWEATDWCLSRCLSLSLSFPTTLKSIRISLDEGFFFHFLKKNISSPLKKEVVCLRYSVSKQRGYKASTWSYYVLTESYSDGEEGHISGKWGACPWGWVSVSDPWGLKKEKRDPVGYPCSSCKL